MNKPKYGKICQYFEILKNRLLENIFTRIFPGMVWYMYVYINIYYIYVYYIYQLYILSYIIYMHIIDNDNNNNID